MRGADHSSSGARFVKLYAQVEAAQLRAQELTRQIWASHARVRAEYRRSEPARKPAELIPELWQAPDSPSRVRYWLYARLQAQLASMPVIEQAKGIIMARCGCDAEQAFDAIRRASQRENIKVRELAARIVAHAVDAAQRQPGAVRNGAKPGLDGTVSEPGAAAVVPIAGGGPYPGSSGRSRNRRPRS